MLELGLPIDLAVGDFDSVSRSELEMIQSATKDCMIAPAEKDDTDTELALKITFQLYPEAEVTIFGAFGGRIDHMLSNIFLVSDPELTILGAKYELTSMNYFQKKIYSSNEFVDGPIQVIVPNGYVIVIQTKDRS